MSFDAEKLYKLLPAIYRIRDIGDNLKTGLAENDGVLKSLLAIISKQIAVLEENTDQLYDDQFIETCKEWVVPYIGDLVGTRGLITFPGAPFSQRSQVAKTISYRRRKGTAAVLEEMAYDVTGWTANVVEYFQLLATTQFLNHLRADNLALAPLRNSKLLEYINQPFDRIAHSADVRGIERKRGKYNIPNIGIYLWRIQDYPLTNSPAFRIDDRRFKFDALGKDIALYNFPVTETEITHLAEPINIPMPLRRSVCSRSLGSFYGKEKCMLLLQDGMEIFPALIPDELPENVSAKIKDLICICDLSDLPGGMGPFPPWRNMPADKIAIDPELGRIALPPQIPPLPVALSVNYFYGFSAEMGGGGYERLSDFSSESESVLKIPGGVNTIEEAMLLLDQQMIVEGNICGAIEITNSDFYRLGTELKVKRNVKIEIRAAEKYRPVLIINKELKITGGEDSELTFNGVLICGGNMIVPAMLADGTGNQLQSLEFRHCTLVPGRSGYDTDMLVPVNPRLKVACARTTITASKSIIGGMQISEDSNAVIQDCILDAGDKMLPAYEGLPEDLFGGPLVIKDSTVIGRVKTSWMELASNTIFFSESGAGISDPPVMSERLQEGCVRFSYVPWNSRLPQLYRCYPEKEGDAVRIQPLFNSLRYGDANYCQLSDACADEIKRGAEDDQEMGVFRQLFQAQREFNLRTRLNEYLRFGLEAGIFYGS